MWTGGLGGICSTGVTAAFLCVQKSVHMHMTWSDDYVCLLPHTHIHKHLSLQFDATEKIIY